jgi:hypothetical protein
VLRLLPPQDNRNLIEPLKTMQNRLFKGIVCSKEGIHLVLDAGAIVPSDLASVSQIVFRKWKDGVLLEDSFVLSMSTNQARRTFSEFERLRQLMRTAFESVSWGYAHNSVFTHELYHSYNKHINIALKSESKDETGLEDVHNSVLPLFVETSSIPGRNEITVRA